MEARDWVMIIVAGFTLASSWGQFWIREILLVKSSEVKDPVLEAFKSKKGIAFIALTGIVSAISICLLIIEIMSDEPITRIAIFKISVLSILAFLNIVLVHSLYALRRIAYLEKTINAKIAARVSIGA